VSFSERELHEVVDLVRSVARAEIMPRFRTLRDGDVRTKSGPTDLVTIADEMAEQRLAEAFRTMHPGCAIVGEEAASADPALLEQIAIAPLCFIIDPVDGTSNFAAGLPLFGVIVAVVQNGRTVGAVIHDPIGDDTAVAMAGHGAFMLAADGSRVRLHVSASAAASEMSGAVSWRYMPEPRRSQVCARLPRVAAAWDHRCAAHQYRMLAAGHCHFSVYNRLLPWDHAAGVLLHQEAGGYAALLDGSAPAPSITQGGMICAPDRAGWEALRMALFED
jgi:fructose-1,6-bisphosphatase/inositol monophosphatase family enzyme